MVRPRPRKRGRPRKELVGGEAEAAGEDGEADPAPAALPLFPLGTPVEVRSDESGFDGSFYEAVVAGHHQRSSGGLGYVVTYATLSRSKDGGSPLQEAAAAADVRPRPPPSPSPPRGFAPHEMVEAFHNDGWWAGVVVCAVPTTETEAAAAAGRRVFKVCFPTSRELLEFEETKLRPNRVFRDGRWIPAAEAESGTPLFRDGSQVEVSRSAKTFGKYWSPAIILKVIGATSFLVQYRDAREDGEQVTEIIDSQYIRPAQNIIHMDSKYRFLPSSHVEVFHEGSWWTGAVSEVLDKESTKMYVVKINNKEADMDDVECVHFLTVDHTQLRSKYNWYRGKWVRGLTAKPGNRGGPQLKPRKRPISAALASSSDNVELTASAPCIDSEEISDEPGSSLKDKGNDKDVVLKQVCPDFLVCNGNDQIKHMQSSRDKVVKQQNTVLSFESHFTVPSQSAVTGFHSLKYDPKLCLSGQLELSSSRMITMPSVSQTGQFQASLFGAFGQLRPLPQGPIFGMQSHTIDSRSIVGSEKTFTDQGKQSNYKGGYLMTGSKQNIKFGSVSKTDQARKRLFTDQGKQANEGSYLMTGSQLNIDFGSFSGTGQSRKRLKECVSPQTPEQIGGDPKIMRKRKRMANKKVKEASKLSAISEEPTELNNNNGKDLSKNKDPGFVLLPQVNTVTCTDSRPLNDDTDSQGISIFLREGRIADEIIPSGVSIGADKFQQEDDIGAAQRGATKVSVLIDKSVLSITSTLNNPGEAQVLPSNSSIQCGKEAANAEESAIIMEQGTSEEYCQQCSVMDDANVHLLPSAESCKDNGDKDNNKAMVECVPTDDFSIMGGGVAPNLLPSSENYEDGKKGMGKADHQENTCSVPETKHANADDLSSAISLPVFKKFAAPHEQHGVSPQWDHGSAMVEFAAEASKSVESSEITQLSSIGICNSSEAEQGDTLIDPKDSEHTPMSKYAPSRVQGSCLSLLQRFRDTHESIMAVHRTEPLASVILPFMKTSPMWEHIEAMEVFRIMPQRPNFHKFQQHVPELREGMALGLMLSFANLAESIRRLSIHDEDTLFEEKMKGLSLLEADGFDVRHLRSRLETLVHIRSGTAVLQGAIKDLEKKISHKETDDRHLGTQIRVLNMTVRHLELQANLFRRMMQSAVSQKMNIASEVGRLKTEAGTLERSYLSAEQSFSTAATAPW